MRFRKHKRAQKKSRSDDTFPVQDVADESSTIQSMVKQQASSQIPSDPREYQIELFEKAKKENIIAVLDTGSGKTLIAILLLKHTFDEELESRKAGKKRRLAFFLTDSVALVYQQFAVLECNLDQKVDRFSGDMDVDSWDQAIWDQHFEKNMAIVCTADILANCLIRAHLSMERINLLVFDEAHHAKKNHAYARSLIPTFGMIGGLL